MCTICCVGLDPSGAAAAREVWCWVSPSVCPLWGNLGVALPQDKAGFQVCQLWSLFGVAGCGLRPDEGCGLVGNSDFSQGQLLQGLWWEPRLAIVCTIVGALGARYGASRWWLPCVARLDLPLGVVLLEWCNFKMILGRMLMLDPAFPQSEAVTKAGIALLVREES